MFFNRVRNLFAAIAFTGMVAVAAPAYAGSIEPTTPRDELTARMANIHSVTEDFLAKHGKDKTVFLQGFLKDVSTCEIVSRIYLSVFRRLAPDINRPFVAMSPTDFAATARDFKDCEATVDQIKGLK